MKKEVNMNEVLVWTLRIGIVISACLLVIGMFIYLFMSDSTAAYLDFMVAGIFVLFATPIMRVAMSIFLFAKQKNRLYTVITVIVFINLMLAIFVIPRVMHI